ncbi:MAG: hypothetical protein Q9207_003161 [Kuettlingeria erythrocarpa]
MAWTNPPRRRRKENTCTAWGYSFTVTPQHLTKEDTASMKMSYDTLGEAALARLNVLHPASNQVRGEGPVAQGPFPSAGASSASSASSQPRKRDMFVLLRDHASEDETLTQLWTNVNTVPSWVCWEQLGRGQEVFYRYGGPALTGLAFQSLLGGMVNDVVHPFLSPN